MKVEESKSTPTRMLLLEPTFTEPEKLPFYYPSVQNANPLETGTELELELLELEGLVYPTLGL